MSLNPKGEARVPSLMITTRRTKSGPRYVVRYRLGGRAYPLVHAGSFKTLREAKTRRDLIAGELAAGRNPADALRAMRRAADAAARSPKWAEAYRIEPRRPRRRDTKNIVSHLKADAADVRRPRPGDDHPGRRAGVDRRARR